MLEKHAKLHSKYSRANANMFEYVIHHEKNNIIDVTNELKIDMEKQWFLLDYLYEHLSFKEDILGKSCIFMTIVIYYTLNGINIFIIPLYHYIRNLSFQYREARETFHLRLDSSLTFEMGETILVTGKSGAGNCIAIC